LILVKLKGTIGIDVLALESLVIPCSLPLFCLTKLDAKPLEIKAPSEMVSALEHVIDLQGELDDAASMT
jgi:hypothetical protein